MAPTPFAQLTREKNPTTSLCPFITTEVDVEMKKIPRQPEEVPDRRPQEPVK